LLNPELIPASEAYRLGLVNKVVPADKLMEEAEAIANRSSTYSASAIKLTKMLLTKAGDLPLQEGLEQEVLLSALSIQSGDYQRFAKKFLKQQKQKQKKSKMEATTEKKKSGPDAKSKTKPGSKAKAKKKAPG
jgi:enoyl-CoA hydratase/carnithine racemase